MKSGPRRRLASLALLLAVSLAAFGGAELIYRAFARDMSEKTRSNQPWRERLRRMNRSIYEAAPGEQVYRPRSASGMDMPYGWAGFNAAGMRDRREYPLSAPGRIRVAALGDSIVWSEHLPWNYSLPAALEIKLGRHDTDVLNFGVSGYDLMQSALWYEQAVRPYRPRLTLLVFCMNDAMIMSGPHNAFADAAQKARKKKQDDLFTKTARLRAETIEVVGAQEESRATFKLLARARTLWRQIFYAASDDYTDEYLISFGDPAARRRVREALQRLGGAIAADGGQAWLLISPVLKDWDAYRWQSIHEFVRREAEAAGFCVLDPLPHFRKTTSPEFLRLEGDCLHYNARGNFLLGAWIAKEIEPVLKPSTPKMPSISESPSP